jgi:peptidyl-prolyl cis-trans isomerase B (cyclophilin B)
LKKGIVISIALFLFFSVFQGCAKKPLSQADQLVGTWFGLNKDVGNITFDKTGEINIFNEMMENKGKFTLPSNNKLTIIMKNPQTGAEEPQTFDFILEKDMFKIVLPEPPAGQQALPPLEFKRATSKDLADYKKKQEDSKKEMEKTTQDLENSNKEVSDNYVVFETSLGNIKMELYPEIAPRTVANFINLVKTGFYNRVIFHRVIPDFMIQTGGTSENGSSKDPGYKFEDEINPKALGLTDQVIQANKQRGYIYSDTLKSIKLEYGILAMANAGPNTNGSQIFIITKKEGTDWLNGLHTAFGKVIEGMDVALKIQNVPKDAQDKPLANVIINFAKLVPKK